MAKEFLVCIDSDGCVFDTMEIKHKECFCPSYINHFGLQPVSKYARDAWDFANLYSAFRGVNRFPVLLKALEVLCDRKEVAQRFFDTPELPSLRAYIAAGRPLNNQGIEDYLKQHPDDREMQNVLAWSYDVNKRIGELVHGVPPFPYVRENLEKLSSKADIVVVSATQTAALEREWEENGLLSLVTAVKGQEAGSKKEIIARLKDQYAPGHVLMIGDAPGDRDAAKANGALFYPICPDEEASSWASFGSCMEAFLEGTYAGEKENANIAYFETLLPQEPSWERVRFGSTVGQKFHRDGSVREFKGNTVVADVVAGSSAFEAMGQLRQMVIDAGLDSHLTLLPPESYHITYISGLNDQQRIDDYWPDSLSRAASMAEADDYVTDAIQSVGIPGPARMKFDSVGWGAGCCIIRIVPADASEHKKLYDFRERAAQALGVRRPNHEKYRFHISLGYTRVVTEGEDDQRKQALIRKMEAFMAKQPEFLTTQAYIAYFDDMYAFSPTRLPR